MTDITIPPAALEAVFKLLYPYMDTGGSETMAREVCEDACLAMLTAWPGMWGQEETDAAAKERRQREREEGAETITALRAEVEDLGNRLHHVHRLWANNEHALRAEVERLRDEATRIALEAQKVCLQNIQMKFALGYPMDANLEKYVLPENPFKCGTCAASRAENEKLQADLRLAVTSDSEYCATIDRINAALLDAPTVDIDVVVPDRDYSTMTPKDCYEAGLLDGVYQAREAIKAAARAALEKKDG